MIDELTIIDIILEEITKIIDFLNNNHLSDMIYLSIGFYIAIRLFYTFGIFREEIDKTIMNRAYFNKMSAEDLRRLLMKLHNKKPKKRKKIIKK